jgi:uncharacterized phage protein gp47/JayE
VPITATGFETRTLAEIVEAVQDELRARISDKLDLSERTVAGNLTQIFCEHLSQVEQVAAEAYASFDVDAASDDRLVALGLLIGVPRRGATKGLVTATVNLQASQTYAAGDLVAHVADEADNRWVNRDAVVSTTAGNYSAVFEAETAGSQGVAPAGTLTVLAEPVAGWNTVTNALDATEGTDIEAIEDLRLRMQLAVSSGGSRTRGAIRAKLVQLEGVIAAEVFENTTSTTDGDGIPPHAIRAVVWDGSPAQADDDAIAQIIFDHKAEGIVSDGGESGVAQDDVLGPVTVAFERATNSVATIAVAIESAAGVAITDVEDAIIAAMPQLVGEALVYNKIAAAVFKVPGVDDWTTLTINAGTADLPATVGTIYTATAASITVTGDVS